MINERLKALRDEMAKHGMDCYIIPSFDAHQSEYVADHWKSREYISGFDGSAGTVVVTMDEACLWADGRYHVQAAKQIEGSEFKLFKFGLTGVQTFEEWILDNMGDGSVIGFDGTVLSYKIYEDLLDKFEVKDVTFDYSHDLMSVIWEDRPSIPLGEVLDLDIKYAGKSRPEKLSDIRAEMKKVGAEAYIVPNLDDICWTFNIRGKDIDFCPFVVSYAVILEDAHYLFVDERKLPMDVRNALIEDDVNIEPYADVFKFLSEVDIKSVVFEPAYTSVSLVKSLKASVKLIEKGMIINHLKGIKHEVEIKNMRNSQVKDGVAMVRFIKWLDENVKTGSVTELTVEEKLREFRAEQPLNVGESFNTIAGYKANAAMMHYRATKESHATLKEEGFLLFDSGGQYLDGTTDITRTFAVGPTTEEEMIDYTLTLKGHINLATAKFLYGATGPQIDILARQAMWERGIDYKCGTGHGLGFFLSVHEGPHTIGPRKNDVRLEKGMVITNEPGVYKPGRHGIRLENTVLVVEDQTTEFGDFYKFETISYCPLDTKPLVKDLLTEKEVSWLNDYHKTVFEKLSPLMNEEEVEYLKMRTQAI